MSSRTLLACFAHPDDESFGTGGMFALYSAAGVSVHLVCTTSGEEGEIAGNLATPENLGEVRRAELQEAVRLLGVDSLEFFGYRDSGMAGTPANENPQAYVRAGDDEVVGRLVATIRRLKPNVVVTFDPHGAYGHPDHIAIHHHTVAAVAAAGDASLYPEAGAPWEPERLYFTAIPRRGFDELREQLKAAGVDTSQLERPDMPIPGQADEDIHVALDVGAVLETKRAAVNAHRTQLAPNNPLTMFPEEFTLRLMATEYFTLASGKPLPAGEIPASDLFAGL